MTSSRSRLPWLIRGLAVTAGAALLFLHAEAPGLGPDFLAEPGVGAEAGEVAAVAPEGADEASPSPAVADPAVERLRRDLQAVIDGTGWRTSRWSVLAVSLERGDTLFAHEPDLPLAPASNVKILTSAAALELLGPEYRYPTFLLSESPIEGGVLQGDLILYGTGDPALSDRFLETRTEALEGLARNLRERGVERIAGDVVGDGSFFTGPMVHETWNHSGLNDWYSAPASALSVNENVVTLRIAAGRNHGEPPVVHTIPEGAEVPLALTARTVGGTPSEPVLVRRDDPGDPIEIRGEMRVGQQDVWRRITVQDPPLYAASLLRRALEEEGIRVDGGTRTVTDADRSAVGGAGIHAPALGRTGGPRVLAVHESPPLAELLDAVNRTSHNLFAELLLMTVGKQASGEGSYRSGVQALVEYLENGVGIPPGTVHLEDGSGLSRFNQASAASLIQVLQHASRFEHAEPFWQSMPRAGHARELRRMYRSAAAGNLQAKTGTIRHVSALSGRVRTADGETVLFSIVANDVPSSAAAKRLEDRIGVRLADFRRGIPLAPAPDPGEPPPGAGTASSR